MAAPHDPAALVYLDIFGPCLCFLFDYCLDTCVAFDTAFSRRHLFLFQVLPLDPREGERENLKAGRSDASKAKKHRHTQTWHGDRNKAAIRGASNAAPGTVRAQTKVPYLSEEERQIFQKKPSLLNDSSFQPRVIQGASPYVRKSHNAHPERGAEGPFMSLLTASSSTPAYDTAPALHHHSPSSSSSTHVHVPPQDVDSLDSSSTSSLTFSSSSTSSKAAPYSPQSTSSYVTVPTMSPGALSSSSFSSPLTIASKLDSPLTSSSSSSSLPMQSKHDSYSAANPNSKSHKTASKAGDAHGHHSHRSQAFAGGPQSHSHHSNQNHSHTGRTLHRRSAELRLNSDSITEEVEPSDSASHQSHESPKTESANTVPSIRKKSVISGVRSMPLVPRRHSSMQTLMVNSVLHSPNMKEIVNCFSRAIFGSICSFAELEKPNLLDIYSEYIHPMNVGDINSLPAVEEIVDFVTRIYVGIALAPENCVMALAYMERLVALTNVTLHPSNWRRITLASLLLASKVWEDLAVHNKDILRVFPDVKLRDLLLLEHEFLSNLQFTVSISASIYAKYYFELRTLSDTDAPPLEPLTEEAAVLIEARSRGHEARVAGARRAARRRRRRVRSVGDVSHSVRFVDYDAFRKIGRDLERGDS